MQISTTEGLGLVTVEEACLMETSLLVLLGRNISVELQQVYLMEAELELEYVRQVHAGR